MKRQREASRLDWLDAAPCTLEGLFVFVRRVGLIDVPVELPAKPRLQFKRPRHALDHRKGVRQERTMQMLRALCVGERRSDIARRFGVTPAYISMLAQTHGMPMRPRVKTWPLR